MSETFQQAQPHSDHAHKRRSVSLDGIIGESPAIRALLAKVAIVARTQSPVLIRGESGTGKELIAKAIHELSARADASFIKVNCAALPESVLESELFGHERGAFTNAISARKGRFELADKGTLFLDEIGAISPGFQAKLLRVLQEQEFERVGGSATIKINVRVVAATNRNLEEAVSRKEFRADLYYRLHVVPIALPPLRDRPGDIPLLAAKILADFNNENGRCLTLDPSAIRVIEGCAFPGNVRELENCIRRTATLAQGPALLATDFACRHNECLSSVLWNRLPKRGAPSLPANPSAARPDQVKRQPKSLGVRSTTTPATTVTDEQFAERARLVGAMEQAGWVQTKAARLLGMTPRKVAYALKRYAIEIKRL
jgi:Nif-specific regulatory protein